MVYLSHVFVPSPHGALRTVTCNFFVGMRTGPLTFNRFSLAPRIKSEHTFSKFFTFLEERVMRILWMRCASASPAFAAAGFPSTAADIITISASFEGEREKETTRQRAREETKRKETNPQGPKAPRETHEKDAKIIGIRAEKHARDPAKTPRTREIRTSLNERLRLGINFFCVRVARFLYSRLSDRSEEISSPPFSSFLWKLNPYIHVKP